MRVLPVLQGQPATPHRPTRWLTGVSVLTLGAVMAVAPAAAQAVIDYDAGVNGANPLVLTQDTILRRNFQNIAAATQSGAISGAFNLTKTGWGALQLTGNNSGYSGTTTLAEGFLILGHDNALGTGALRMQEGTVIFNSGTRTFNNAIVLDANGAVVINVSGGAMTLNGVVSGIGTLQKEGGNTLFLNSANTYSGGTVINNGTIVAGDNNALGSGDVQLNSAGNLTIESGVSLANDIELTGIASNNGELSVAAGDIGRYYGNITERTAGLGYTKSGAGLLEVYGTNSHTGLTHIAEGTLIAASAGALSQLSDVQIDSGALLELQHTSNMAGLFGQGRLDTTSYLASIGYDNGDGLFEGEVIGSGMIGKRGAGTQVFSGDSVNFDGQAYAEVGTLIIDSDFSDAEGFVMGGATLGGRGIMQSIASIGGGTLAPGSGLGDIGTLSTTGRIDLDSDSVLRVDVNDQGQSDLLSAGTTAALAGSVDVRAAAGTYAPSTTYRIVTSGSGITGSFASVTTDLAFLTPELTYDADSVWLSLSRSTRSFADIDGLTFNQRAVAPAAEALGAGNVVHDALLVQNEEGARAGFDSLSGEIHASQATVLTQNAQLVRDALMQRMRGGPSNGVLSDLDTASAADEAVAADAWNLSIWSGGLGGPQGIEGDGNAARVTAGTGGFLFGLEADHADGFKVGVAGGYSGTHMDSAAGPGAADISSIHLATYGAAEIGALALRGGAAYAWNAVNTTRQVTIGGFTDTLTANYGARTAQVFGEAGYSIAVGSTIIEPFAGIAHVAVGADGFTEAGGAAALTAAALTHGTTYTTIGVRGAHDVAVSEAGTLTASAGIAWQHALDAGAPTRDLAFASGGSAFTVACVPAARDSLLIEGGLDWQMTNGATIGAHYNGVLGGASQSHAVKGNVAFSF